MFRTAAGALTICLFFTIGCATHGEAGPAAPRQRPSVDETGPAKPEPRDSMLVRRPSPVLLFDRRPGRIQPDDFTYRPDWPAAVRSYDTEDWIVYVETIYDYEGAFGPFRDQTRRYYRSYRVGAAPR